MNQSLKHKCFSFSPCLISSTWLADCETFCSQLKFTLSKTLRYIGNMMFWEMCLYVFRASKLERRKNSHPRKSRTWCRNQLMNKKSVLFACSMLSIQFSTSAATKLCANLAMIICAQKDNITVQSVVRKFRIA